MRSGAIGRPSPSGCAPAPRRRGRWPAAPSPRYASGWDSSSPRRPDDGPRDRHLPARAAAPAGPRHAAGRRELGGKPAGLRTNILICIGSALYTQLSLTMVHGATDATRVAGQIVTGVGFIGAGTILHARGAVVGLTSAATIWVVAAIGVALGAGHYAEALLSTLVVLVVLQGLGRIEIVVERHSTKSNITVHARPDGGPLEELETVIRRTGLEIVRHTTRRENVDLVIEYQL